MIYDVNKFFRTIENWQDMMRYMWKNSLIAIAHWYLDKYYKLSEQQIAEAIIDGSDDLGIDAVIIDEDNKSLTVMQFKFPGKNTTINYEID